MKEPEKKPSPEVREFANALHEWAAQGTPPEQKQRETLLKWLLSRTESRGFKGSKGKYVIERIDIEDINIDEAVMHAMAGYNPDLPTSGWVRGGPFWPKAYGNIWPKAYGS